jgi:hypothetical protein
MPRIHSSCRLLTATLGPRPTPRPNPWYRRHLTSHMCPTLWSRIRPCNGARPTLRLGTRNRRDCATDRAARPRMSAIHQLIIRPIRPSRRKTVHRPHTARHLPSTVLPPGPSRAGPRTTVRHPPRSPARLQRQVHIPRTQRGALRTTASSTPSCPGRLHLLIHRPRHLLLILRVFRGTTTPSHKPQTLHSAWDARRRRRAFWLTGLRACGIALMLIMRRYPHGEAV